jgi:FAD/FMN-containing dehydrogenase
VTVSGSWDDPGLDQDGIAWAREVIDAQRAWEHPGAYANYISRQESPLEASAMYGSAIYGRLAQVKQAYDPGNMFRSTRNIIPEP